MAKALIIDDAFGKLANAYYAVIPNEPLTKTTSLSVESRITVPHTSLKTLLSTIKDNAKTADDLIIVSHGNQNGMIMKMNVDAPHSVAAISARLNTLTGTEIPADKAKQLGISEDQVKELLSLIAGCQSIKLGHVAFRGCSIGINSNNLDILKDVLGAKAVSGTDLLSTYGTTPAPWVEKKSGEFDNWKKSYGKNSTIWLDKVMFYSVDTKGHTTKIGLFVRDVNDIAEWLKVNFLPSRKSSSSILWRSLFLCTISMMQRRSFRRTATMRPTFIHPDGGNLRLQLGVKPQIWRAPSEISVGSDPMASISQGPAVRCVITAMRWSLAVLAGYVLWKSVVPAILFALFS